MLNLTRREKSVIIFLVLLYIVGCGIYFGKNLLPVSPKQTIIADSVKIEFQKQAQVVDSLYFNKNENTTTMRENETNTLISININTATLKELIKIKGVGPVTAEKIIEYRKINGKFNSVEELKKVKGIGDKTLEKIKGEVTIE